MNKIETGWWIIESKTTQVRQTMWTNDGKNCYLTCVRSPYTLEQLLNDCILVKHLDLSTF